MALTRTLTAAPIRPPPASSPPPAASVEVSARTCRDAEILIACGGTGGHLFPGLAVAEALRGRGAKVRLLISEKSVDHRAVARDPDLEPIALPAVGYSRRHPFRFARGLTASWRRLTRVCRQRRPDVLLAMGGFTSVPAVLTARQFGVPVLLHESNAVPGKANRWLARLATTVLVGFPECRLRFRHPDVRVTGTPVRPQFGRQEPGPCRVALGLAPDRPVLVVMGGSQGASAINQLVLAALDTLAQAVPGLQYFHLAGEQELEQTRRAYAARPNTRAEVRDFYDAMGIAFNAASVVVARAGASTLAELAATRAPAVLIPYPLAADDHQSCNARILAERGAARVLAQAEATPDLLARQVAELGRDGEARRQCRLALDACHYASAADTVAACVIEIRARAGANGRARRLPPPGPSHNTTAHLQ